MRFLPTEEQRDFARSLDAMLTAADTPAAIRAWATGDPAPGRALWSRLAQAGLFALAVPEPYEGLGPLPVELTTAFVEAGRHGVPGPLVETVAASALLAELAHRGEPGPAKRLLPGMATGESVTTLAVGRAGGRMAEGGAEGRAGGRMAEGGAEGRAGGRMAEGGAEGRAGGRMAEGRAEGGPGGRMAGGRAEGGPGGRAAAAGSGAGTSGLALDADRADVILVVDGDELRLAPGHEEVRASADPARRLARPASGGEVLAAGPAVAAAVAQARDWAMLATAAQSLGVGLTLLDRTVVYAKQRSQFGAPIGSFQAVKHRLADTLIALEFARPLVLGAAVTLRSTDLAAAKVAAGEAAYTAARTALQIHGAVGYTEELDLSLWLRKARPLRDAWGTPSWCRARVMETYGGVVETYDDAAVETHGGS
ncbi:acyl-CoA dehydrogenase family protein [Streptomyces sp. NPDC090127]|uniref:acyl-CoA dehydrogenase family protein n=1 Tax=Streptomyces sp. NPDC090127 TaxID=3365953 RepID=UPI003829145D